MGLTAVKFEVKFLLCCCSSCGINYYVPENWQNKRRQDHATFYCPNGHGQHFPHETDAEKYKRKSEILADQVRMEHEQREQLQRELERVKKGVCPKCNRSFKALERHMKSKHGVK